MDEAEVRTKVINLVHDSAKRYGSKIRKIDNNQNLMKQGALDSVELIELLAIIETNFDIRINFIEDDLDLFSSINGLVEAVLKHQKTK